MTATLEDVTQHLEILNRTCVRIANLLEFSMHEELGNALAQVFSKPRDITIYELSDGSRSTRDIGKIIGLDQKGISKLWQKWKLLGIVESAGDQKPYRAKYSLIELALQVVTSKAQAKKGQGK